MQRAQVSRHLEIDSIRVCACKTTWHASRRAAMQLVETRPVSMGGLTLERYAVDGEEIVEQLGDKINFETFLEIFQPILSIQ